MEIDNNMTRWLFSLVVATWQVFHVTMVTRKYAVYVCVCVSVCVCVYVCAWVLVETLIRIFQV